MLTPLEIENKKFAKQMMNGYSVLEVDEFLDEVTEEYEKLYRSTNEQNAKIEELQNKMEHYKSIEGTLQNTLIMAQSTAEDIKNMAKQQADQIVREAQNSVKLKVDELDSKVMLKTRELEDLKKQIDIYRAKTEALLISQLELLKEVNED